MNKNLLLKLLEEDDIKQKILEIVNDNSSLESTNFVYDEKVEFLEEEVIDLKNENSILSEQIKEALLTEMEKDKEIEELKEKCKNLNKKLQDTLKLMDVEKQNNMLIYKNLTDKDEKFEKMVKNYLQMEKKYLVLENIYLIYNNLPEDTKHELGEVLKGDDVESFVFSGAQFDNIELLWDFIKDKIIQGETKEVESLEKIFDYFFKRFNSIYDEPLYELIEENETYDSKLHTKISDSKTNNNIKEVLLKGYKNVNSLKVLKKSVVKI